jgi:hypothetical protein
MRTFGGLMSVAFVCAIGAGVAALVLKARRDASRSEFDRVVRARKLGWNYSGAREGGIDYQFSARHGAMDWSMWHDSDRGDESPTPKAYWCCENLRTARLSLVIIGRKRYDLESGTFGRLLMGGRFRCCERAERCRRPSRQSRVLRSSGKARRRRAAVPRALCRCTAT